MPLDRLEYRVGIGASRQQHDGRADGKRERQRIAEAVREENLRWRKHDIVFIDFQDAATVREPRVERVVLQMHDALRPSRRAGAVHPKRHRVAMRVGRNESPDLFGAPLSPFMMNRKCRRGIRRDVADMDDVAKSARCDAFMAEQRSKARIDERRFGAAVLQKISDKLRG